MELDYVGLRWDADFIREPGRVKWRVRMFRGTRWQVPQQAEAIANQVNTYRVLLTRARYDTVIFVPNGNEDDRTRDPAVYNDIATFLQDCGARDLDRSRPDRYSDSDAEQDNVLAQGALELPSR
ncbi:MAG TPA: DNA/RNA helicase domain-containing protein [Acetobacteraceae bacterium]|nr:DNA/RNA helicase domain-containing protein [Acetobacteraceae bacterium]